MNRLAVYQRIKQKISKAWFCTRLWLQPHCSMPLCLPTPCVKGSAFSLGWDSSQLTTMAPVEKLIPEQHLPSLQTQRRELASWGVIWLSCFRLGQVLSSLGVLGVLCPKSSYYSPDVSADQIKLPAIQI